jgi:hypothetical protein
LGERKLDKNKKVIPATGVEAFSQIITRDMRKHEDQT